VITAVAAIAFVMLERRVADPMLDLSLFGNRTFLGATIALMLWAFGLFGIYFFTSLYLQHVLGFSATTAGAAFVPMALLIAAGAAMSDRVAARIGANRAVAIAMALMGSGIVSVSLLGPRTTFAQLLPSFAVIGLGGGLTTPLTSTILKAMPADRSGVASAVFNASREVAGLLGITVIGVVLRIRENAELHLGRGPMSAFLSGYRLGLVIAGLLVTAGAVAAWLSLRDASAAAPKSTPAPRQSLATEA
jgi:predicted MFS family arabinose efflux permease